MIYLCPKCVNENTPVAYREWMIAIADTLDKTVEETDYHNMMIQKVFEAIEEDGLTPRDRYNMIEEYEDQLFVDTERQDSKKEIAKNLLAENVEIEIIAKTTGLSLSEIETLANPLCE